jgi:macrolide transport system ATP-binding/permease protein
MKAGGADRFGEALRAAGTAMRAHRLRTFLTMLGIVIGIASVACAVALGEGGRERVLADIRQMGTNTLDIYPDKQSGDETLVHSVHNLTGADLDALSEQPYIDSLTPTVATQALLRFDNVSFKGLINGVGEQYFRVHGLKFAAGQAFSSRDMRELAQVAVIDENARDRIFSRAEDALGQVIFLSNMPVRIVGVVKIRGGILVANPNLNVWVPYTAVLGRLLGGASLQSITARIREGTPMEQASDAAARMLLARHGRKDFFISNTDTVRNAVESASATMRLLIASIAVISLLVGGIGVMNIMLVSVTERAREIGIRIAVGARRSDILQQFLIESTLVCLASGFLGVVLAVGIGWAFSHMSNDFPMIFSTDSMIASLTVSTVIGVASGYLPARQAASIDPVEALARE